MSAYEGMGTFFTLKCQPRWNIENIIRFSNQATSTRVYLVGDVHAFAWPKRILMFSQTRCINHRFCFFFAFRLVRSVWGPSLLGDPDSPWLSSFAFLLRVWSMAPSRKLQRQQHKFLPNSPICFWKALASCLNCCSSTASNLHAYTCLVEEEPLVQCLQMKRCPRL